MSTQQDIYVAGSENHPPMLDKDNYISWSSRLLPYTDDELITEEAKQVEVDDQAIQIILMGLPEDIYEKEAKLLNELERFTFIEGESIELYYHRFAKLMNDLDRNQLTPKLIACNLKFAIKGNLGELSLKRSQTFKLNYTTPTNDNQRISSNPQNRQIAQSIMNMGQEIHMQMVGGNGGNQFRQYAGQNAVNPIRYNARQNARIQIGKNVRNLIGFNVGQHAWNQIGHNAIYNRGMLNVGNQNGLIVVPGIANNNRNGNQASTSGTHADKALVNDLDGSAEVHQYENCYNNKIFNMFAQEEQYTELLEYTNDTHLVQHSNVILVDFNMNLSGGELEQHPLTIKETHAFYKSLYNNLVIEVEKVNTINRKTKEANVKLTAELARYRG
nr:hypothetical protein [Tanacetum cinerariifolium]